MKQLFKFGGELSSSQSKIVGIVGAILLLVLWWVAAVSGSISSKILPNPIDVICSIPSLYADKNLIGNIYYTISLNWLGYFYALIIAIPLGYIIGIYPAFRSMFQKPLGALRFLPVPAVTGLFIAALGLGFDMKASFLAFGILIFILPTVIQRVCELQDKTNVKDNVYLETAKTIGMNNWQMFRYVYWPYVMEKVYVDIRNLCAISYSYVTIAEALNREGGLGASINIMTRQSDIASVYALLFIIIIIGVCQDQLFRIFEPIIFKHKKA